MLVIAHPGASGNAPENTLAAFKKAVALGAPFIETDLQLSRDAHFVAIHDATVNRTTNGQGAVHDMKLAELRRLDAGSWFGSEFAGERIPTLEEVLEFSKKNDVVFYLEIKPGGSWGGEKRSREHLLKARNPGERSSIPKVESGRASITNQPAEPGERRVGRRGFVRRGRRDANSVRPRPREHDRVWRETADY